MGTGTTVARATTTESDDYTAITRLQAAYGDVVTRQAWDELIPMFLPDCPVRLDLRRGTVIETIGPEAIGALIASSIERFEFFAFTLLNTVVEIRPDGRHTTRGSTSASCGRRVRTIGGPLRTASTGTRTGRSKVPGSSRPATTRQSRAVLIPATEWTSSKFRAAELSCRGESAPGRDVAREHDASGRLRPRAFLLDRDGHGRVASRVDP